MNGLLFRKIYSLAFRKTEKSHVLSDLFPYYQLVKSIGQVLEWAFISPPLAIFFYAQVEGTVGGKDAT